jgi:hypothetical protein
VLQRNEWEIFLGRVHARQVMRHLAERSGLGMLLGCGVAFPEIGLLVWHGSPALGFAAAALLIGVAAGLLWGILTRPTLLAAAMEVDRQLQWADLLSTVFLVRSNAPEDSWAAAVGAEAEARCRGTSPHAVSLGRLGARAWGGIGLAMALLVAIALLPALAAPAGAGAQQGLLRNSLASLAGDSMQARVASAKTSRRTSSQSEPEDANASRMKGIEQPQEQGGVRQNSSELAGRDQQTAPQSDGQGRGAGQSKMKEFGDHLAASAGTRSRGAASGGHATGGTGQGSTQLPSAGEASGQAAGDSLQKSAPTPPWQSAQWGDDSKRAQAAVQSGRIPDSYLSVIRDYFERP